MTHQGEEATGVQAPAGMPGTRYLLASCGLVATAAYLGTQWLRHPVAGLPAGVWAIGIAQAAGYAWALRRARRRILSSSQPGSLPLAAGAPESAGLAGLDVNLMFGRIAAAAWEGMRGLGSGASGSSMGDFERRASDWIDRTFTGPTEIRVGLDVGPELAAAFRSGERIGDIPVRFIPCAAGSSNPDLSRLRLDVLLTQRDDAGVTLMTPESEGHDAAWYDWNATRPLTYGSVFPTRLDAARATLAEFDASEAAEVAVLRSLLRTAAVLSRSLPRLTLADRLRGRTPINNPAALIEQEITLLSGSLNSTRPATPVRRSAARVVSAFMAASDSWVAPAARRAAMRAALGVIADEPEAQLRAAAVGLSCGDDAWGFAALSKAADLIRSTGKSTEVDHLAFLQAEVECGSQGPMTLGRVAAGVALVCATSPADRVPFIRADFMDDVRYSAWLVGRDQDRAVLMEAFRRMEHQGEPAKLAA